MIKTGHLGKLELYAIVVVTSVTQVFLTFPQQLVAMGGTAGWIIPLLSMAIGLVIWWLISPVLRKMSNKQEFFRMAEGSLGKWLFRGLLLVVAGTLILDTASTIRLFTETVITTVLPRSPISFIAIPFVLVTIYYAYQGVEGLSRVALLLFPGMFLGTLILLILNLNWMHLENIFPFFGHGLPALFGSGLHVLSVFSNLLYVAILAGNLRKPSDAVKIGYWSILTVGLAYATVTFAYLLVFPEEAAVRSAFPLYQLGRLIYIGRFIQRLESAFVFIWVTMALIDMAFMLWVSTYLLATVFKMPVNRPLVFPLALLCYAIAFIPRSFPEMLEWSQTFIRSLDLISLVFLPMAILLWVRVRNRHRKGGATDEQAA